MSFLTIILSHDAINNQNIKYFLLSVFESYKFLDSRLSHEATRKCVDVVFQLNVFIGLHASEPVSFLRKLHKYA